MARNEKAKATIYLDGKQAEAALDGLRKKSKELEKALMAAEKAGDMEAAKKIRKELKGVDSAINSSKKEIYDYKKVLDNLSGVSKIDKIQFESKSQLSGGYITTNDRFSKITHYVGIDADRSKTLSGQQPSTERGLDRVRRTCQRRWK